MSIATAVKNRPTSQAGAVKRHRLGSPTSFGHDLNFVPVRWLVRSLAVSPQRHFGMRVSGSDWRILQVSHFTYGRPVRCALKRRMGSLQRGHALVGDT
jgi:hypothetical protein